MQHGITQFPFDPTLRNTVPVRQLSQGNIVEPRSVQNFSLALRKLCHRLPKQRDLRAGLCHRFWIRRIVGEIKDVSGIVERNHLAPGLPTLQSEIVGNPQQIRLWKTDRLGRRRTLQLQPSILQHLSGKFGRPEALGQPRLQLAITA